MASRPGTASSKRHTRSTWQHCQVARPLTTPPLNSIYHIALTADSHKPPNSLDHAVLSQEVGQGSIQHAEGARNAGVQDQGLSARALHAHKATNSMLTTNIASVGLKG